MNDKTLGILIFTLSLLAMIGYFCWLFLAPKDMIILGKPLRDWALIVPIMIIVYAFLFIVAWIGWAMASTPPPLPLTKKTSEEEEETEKEEESARISARGLILRRTIFASDITANAPKNAICAIIKNPMPLSL